jgi:hypothetical protein
LQDLEGLGGSQGVGEVAEVDEVDDLFRRQAQQLPQGQSRALGLEVPQGVDDGAD